MLCKVVTIEWITLGKRVIYWTPVDKSTYTPKDYEEPNLNLFSSYCLVEFANDAFAVSSKRILGAPPGSVACSTQSKMAATPRHESSVARGAPLSSARGLAETVAWCWSELTRPWWWRPSPTRPVIRVVSTSSARRRIHLRSDGLLEDD